MAVVVITIVGVVAAACSSSDDTSKQQDTTTSSSAVAATDVPSLFAADALTEDITTVDCTLENSSASTCYSITVNSDPTTVEPGPFCPTTIDSDDSGIFTWDGDEPGLYALNQAFWELLAGQGYAFANSDGSINAADPAAAPPAGDSCLQATADDSYTLTALIPATPEVLDTPTDLSTVAQVGIALDGVTVFGDAPSGTTGAIPALDPCGGHHDPSGYYHWHFGPVSIQTNLDNADVARTCNEDQDAEALFGFAFDGYAIYGPLEDGAEPGDLDECNGHIGDRSVYHYHLSYESPNLPPCRVGATANDKLTSRDNPDVQLPDSGGPGGAGGGPPGGAGGPPPGAPPPPGALQAASHAHGGTRAHTHT